MQQKHLIQATNNTDAIDSSTNKLDSKKANIIPDKLIKDMVTIRVEEGILISARDKENLVEKTKQELMKKEHRLQR